MIPSKGEKGASLDAGDNSDDSLGGAPSKELKVRPAKGQHPCKIYRRRGTDEETGTTFDGGLPQCSLPRSSHFREWLCRPQQ